MDIGKMEPVRKQACQELLRRGNIEWILHPEQVKLLHWLDEKPRDISVVVMSRQWGKTFLLLCYAIAHCLKYPKHTVLFVAPHYTQLETIILPRMNQIFQFMPEDSIPHRRLGVWSFRNGSILRLDGVSTQKGIRLRGDAVHLVIMDECRDVPALEEMVQAHIMPMFTTTNGRLVMISTPPDSPAHAFTSVFIKEAIERNDLYLATYRANPLLSTNRLRYLINTLYPGGEQNAVFQREYCSNYQLADPERRVIREFDEDANAAFFASYQGPSNLVRPYVGLDYAHADPCGIIAGWFDPMAGAFVVHGEHFARHMNTQDVGLRIIELRDAMLKALPRGCPDPIMVMDIDPALMADLLNQFGLRFEPAWKINSALAMMNRVRVAILEGKVRISPHCQNLLYQIKTGVFNVKLTDYLRTEKTGHLDLIDALKYIVINCRWSELVRQIEQAQPLRHNQMRVSPFAAASNFKSGIISRPT